VAAEPAVAVEWPCDASAVAALVQLETAVRAARFFGVIEHHRGLVTTRTQAWRDERERRQLHTFISR